MRRRAAPLIPRLRGATPTSPAAHAESPAAVRRALLHRTLTLGQRARSPADPPLVPARTDHPQAPEPVSVQVASEATEIGTSPPPAAVSSIRTLGLDVPP